MVAQALDIARETYFAILLDRETSGPIMVGSPKGGVDIEEVAAKDPGAIFKVSAGNRTRLIKGKLKQYMLTCQSAKCQTIKLLTFSGILYVKP